MRDNDTLPAVLAFFAGAIIIAGAIGAFVVFAGEQGATTDMTPANWQTSETLELKPDCTNSAACREPTAEFAAAYNDPSVCKGDGLDRRICLVPLGYVPLSLVDDLVAYYRDDMT
jgi:hypothetical protein